MEIREYVEVICELLEIEKPNISYDASHFPTKTTLAQCDCNGTTLYLSPETDYESRFDYHFAIAHELRHIWQIRTDWDLYFSDYQTVDKLGSEAYNNQLAEVDANAFGVIVMADLFGVKPTFSSLSSVTKTLIEMRIEFIEKQY